MADDFPNAMIPSEMGYPSPSPINIQFEHIAIGIKVEFFAWITSFSDVYTSDWNSQTLYGRMDPMMTFKNTSRKITLEWDVVAASLQEAKVNMSKMSRFIKFQYPTYAKGAGAKGGGGASMIGSPPLMRVKFLNWINNALNGKGLVCALEGVTFKPNLEHGTFADDSQLYPQSFALSVTMTVLHEHALGFSDEKPGVFGTTFGIDSQGNAKKGSVVNASKFPYSAPHMSALKQEHSLDNMNAVMKKLEEVGNAAVSTPNNATANEGDILGGGSGTTDPDSSQQ